jgi:hypothetical protein
LDSAGTGPGTANMDSEIGVTSLPVRAANGHFPKGRREIQVNCRVSPVASFKRVSRLAASARTHLQRVDSGWPSRAFAPRKATDKTSRGRQKVWAVS